MKKSNTLILLCTALMIFSLSGNGAATVLDVYDWDVDKTSVFGQIDTIATAQTGQQHYSYSSASGHPTGVNLAPLYSSFWVHENTSTTEYTFGFIFSMDNGGVENEAELNFRIVDSLTDVYVSQSDDPGEAVETIPGAFLGDYWYSNNTDGIAVSGITGSGWTIIIDSVDFGNITNWFAADEGGSDLSLTLGHEYRIVLEGVTPSGAPVTGEPVPEPATMLLIGSGLLGLAGFRRFRKR